MNQFLNGYTDYDQLIREEIYGQSEYNYVEFQFPGAVMGTENGEGEEGATDSTDPNEVIFVGDPDSVDGEDLIWDGFGTDDEE